MRTLQVEMLMTCQGACSYCGSVWPPPYQKVDNLGHYAWICNECLEEAQCVFCDARQANYKHQFESGQYMPVCDACMREDNRVDARGDLLWFVRDRVIYMTSEGRPSLISGLRAFGPRYQVTIDVLENWLIKHLVPTNLVNSSEK